MMEVKKRQSYPTSGKESVDRAPGTVSGRRQSWTVFAAEFPAILDESETERPIPDTPT